MSDKKNCANFDEYAGILQEVLNEQRYLLRAKSYRSYHSVLTRFLQWKAENYPKANTEYLTYLLAKGVAVRTAYNNMTALKGLLNRVCEKYPDAEHGLEKIRKLRYQSRSPQVFSEQQLQILRIYLSNTKPYFWIACSLQYYCYIRPNELRYLRVRDVDLIRHKIFISQDFAKNKKDNFVTIPKPLRPSLNFVLRENPSHYLFGNNRDYAPSKEQVFRDKMSREFKRALQVLGINGRYSFYSLKHTGVERAVRAGINIKEIQVQLRHHSLDMVNEYLKNLGVFELKDIDEKFPKI